MFDTSKVGYFQDIKEPGYVSDNGNVYDLGSISIQNYGNANPCSEINFSGQFSVILPNNWDQYSFKDKMDWLYSNGVFTEYDKVQDNIDKLGL